MLGAAEGIADKILDCHQHRRHELRILAHRILGRHVGDQQPGMTVDQEHVFDLVDQRVLEHDLGEGRSSAPGFPAPFEPSPGEAVFQALIEPLERRVNGLADRFADRRHDRRVKNVDQRRGIIADRALRRPLHDGRQHMPHPLIARRLGDRGRQDAPDRRGEALGIVHHAGEPRQRLDLAADQQRPQLLELQIVRVHAVSLRAELRPQALRDFDEQTRQRFPIDGVIARGRPKQRLENIGGVAHITALADRPATRWFDTALDGGRRVLVQALGDLDEQPGQQVAIGLDVAELGEHFFDRVLKILVLALDLLAQRLRFLGQAVGHVALELAQLVRRRAQPLFQRLIVLAQRPLDLLVGIGAQVLFFAELARERLHLLLRVRFEGAEIARRLRLNVLEALEKSLLQLRKAAIVVLHLIAEQEIADLVHAHDFGASKRTVAQLRGGYGID